jgi:hypothetical protein
MPDDVTIILEDRPGTLAMTGEILGKAGINIDGMCGFLAEGKGEIHILVDNGHATRKELERAGIKVRNVRPVLLIELENKPGTLGKAARQLADIDVNMDLLYLVSDNRLVIGVNPDSGDWDKAKSIFK